MDTQIEETIQEDIEIGADENDVEVDLGFDEFAGALVDDQFYLQRLAQHSILTRQEEVALAKRIEKGDDLAKNTLVEHNARLVMQIARKYVPLSKQSGGSLDYMDLVQEGFIGLNRAAEKFDHRRGFKFSTYATWWVRQSVARAIADKSSTVRIPVHIRETLKQIYQYEKPFVIEHGRPPTDEELAEALDKELPDIVNARKAEIRMTSLDQGIGEDKETEFGAFLADESVDVEAEALGELGKEFIEGALAKLKPIEREILTKVYLEEKTLRVTGKELGISAERVRQHEHRAVGKLRKLQQVAPEKAKGRVNEAEAEASATQSQALAQTRELKR